MAAIVDISGTYLPPTPPRTWNNRYYFVRHGQSKANESGLIVSGIEGLEKRYGLTALRVSQAHQAAKTLKHEDADDYSLDVADLPNAWVLDKYWCVQRLSYVCVCKPDVYQQHVRSAPCPCVCTGPGA
eukprot:m.211552 g.211552  ORF g.211552 m.211552 type:complete len:128 (-) comp17151_c0_seq4:688-1071(-)